jgi:hypothetical protein
MSFAGSFKQHFYDQQGFWPEIMHFDNTAVATNSTTLADTSFVRTNANMFGDDGVDGDRMTLSLWLYPIKQTNWTNDTRHYIYYTKAGNALISLNHRGSGLEFLTQSASLQDNSGNRVPQVLNFGQWNHILFSVKMDKTSVTSGSNTGTGWDNTTKRQYSFRTGDSSRLHLIINGTGYHRYVEPNQPGEDASNGTGFFQNNFATATTGDGRDFGTYLERSTGTSVLTTDNAADTYFGYKGGGTYIAESFRGHLFQLWMKDAYYDLTDSNNVDLFYNSGSHVASLPSGPKLYLAGGGRFSSGSTDPDNDQLTVNKLLKSSLSKP